VSTVGNDRDTLQPELEGDVGQRTASERVASRAHEAIDKAAASASQAEQRVREKAAMAAERARRAEQELEERMSEGVERVRNYVERNPMTAAGIAFVAGVVLSSLFRR